MSNSIARQNLFMMTDSLPRLGTCGELVAELVATDSDFLSVGFFHWRYPNHNFTRRLAHQSERGCADYHHVPRPSSTHGEPFVAATIDL